MKKKALLYRSWRYFRDGFSLYLSYPLSIFNFLTLAYYVMADSLPFLKQLFPSFALFVLIAFFGVVPLGVVLGYLHLRRSQVYSTEVQVNAECNILGCHISRVTMEMLLRLYEKEGIPVTEDYINLLNYWKKLDERGKWKP